jgi:hypothetical protein
VDFILLFEPFLDSNHRLRFDGVGFGCRPGPLSRPGVSEAFPEKKDHQVLQKTFEILNREDFVVEVILRNDRLPDFQEPTYLERENITACSVGEEHHEVAGVSKESNKLVPKELWQRDSITEKVLGSGAVISL